MDTLLPIIRRVRRPLVPVEEPKGLSPVIAPVGTESASGEPATETPEQGDVESPEN